MIECNNHLIKFASYAAVATSCVVLALKIYAWFATESQSLLVSLADSFFDISSSIINMIVIRVATTPPDDNHRFGHEKFQDLAIFSQSIFFLISCMFTLCTSGKALFVKAGPTNTALGAEIMYICSFLTLALVILQDYVIKQTRSKIIAMDRMHYFADFLTNVAVIISLHISIYFWYIDAVIGILISLHIMRASYLLFRDAFKNLSDEEFDTEHRDRIVQVISNFAQVQGMHDLKTRSAGNKFFIQFNLELDESLSLKETHMISDNVYGELSRLFPNAEIVIQQYPVKVS